MDPTANIAVLHVTTLATFTLFGAIHAIVLAWNLDYPVNMAFVLPGVVCVILVVWVRQLLEARREQIAFETTTTE